ncbi:uncharacterized protein LOC129957550 isoform X2 [Argiope bruennichi]|uniref:uncharacterized protein LOC129957550 isoform X2 n=1 Tax=Argiope bruennichi TaxID=94029 RepID=UPI0024955A5B|nr:uncharacterized protein LOC129957550 isoform X2 [Argiope bruennichi]XP_055925883.1 uncharacterized protein LOC129957550 isoform X2 [Argiope bruennichi]
MEFDLNSLHLMSLQELAIRRLAVQLCNQPQMLAYAVKIDPDARYEKEHETTMYDLLKDLLTEVPLPPSMKHELFSLMKSVSREIIKWLELHECYLDPYNLNVCEMENLEHLCWTSLGSVDYRETAVALIRHKKLGMTQRYKLACLYCLEEDIIELWRKMPEKSRKSYYDADPANLKQPDLVIIWTFILEGEVDNFLRYLAERGIFRPSMNHLAFECAATRGYRTAAQYFYEKLTFDEREDLLLNTAISVAGRRSNDYYFYMDERQQFGDVLCYLMSVMQPEQLRTLISRHPCETLKCVLDWPRQDAFIELAKSVFPGLSKPTYIRVLSYLSRNSSWGYNHSKIFQEFFMLSPSDLSYALQIYNDMLQDFFRSDDIETVKFLFRRMDDQEKDAHVLGSAGRSIYYELVKEGKWDLMKLYLEEVQMSRGDRRRIVKYFSRSRALRLEKEEFQRFKDFMNNTDFDIQEEESRGLETVRKCLMPLKSVYDKCKYFLFR